MHVPLLPPATEYRKVMFSVGSVCQSVHGTVLFKLVHLGIPPDLVKLVHYVAYKTISKWAVGLRLKGHLIDYV